MTDLQSALATTHDTPARGRPGAEPSISGNWTARQRSRFLPRGWISEAEMGQLV